MAANQEITGLVAFEAYQALYCSGKDAKLGCLTSDIYSFACLLHAAFPTIWVPDAINS